VREETHLDKRFSFGGSARADHLRNAILIAVLFIPKDRSDLGGGPHVLSTLTLPPATSGGDGGRCTDGCHLIPEFHPHALSLPSNLACARPGLRFRAYGSAIKSSIRQLPNLPEYCVSCPSCAGVAFRAPARFMSKEFLRSCCRESSHHRKHGLRRPGRIASMDAEDRALVDCSN
jgi:hypothetical protein